MEFWRGLLREPHAAMVVLGHGHGIWRLGRLCVLVQPGTVAATTVGMVGEARVILCTDHLWQRRGESC